MTAYYVSTPHWTCLVEVNAAGIMVRTAPYLVRWVQGLRWHPFRRAMQQMHGKNLRVAPLDRPLPRRTIGSNRYATNTRCGACGTAVERGFLYCPACRAQRPAVYRARRIQAREGPGPNQIICCGGTFHAILTQPLRTACCGKVLAFPTKGGA